MRAGSLAPGVSTPTRLSGSAAETEMNAPLPGSRRTSRSGRPPREGRIAAPASRHAPDLADPLAADTASKSRQGGSAVRFRRDARRPRRSAATAPAPHARQHRPRAGPGSPPGRDGASAQRPASAMPRPDAAALARPRCGLDQRPEAGKAVRGERGRATRARPGPPRPLPCNRPLVSTSSSYSTILGIASSTLCAAAGSNSISGTSRTSAVHCARWRRAIRVIGVVRRARPPSAQPRCASRPRGEAAQPLDEADLSQAGNP